MKFSPDSLGRLTRLAWSAVLCAPLAACSLFSNAPQPTPLAPLVNGVAVPVKWQTRLGGSVKYPAQVWAKGGAFVLAGQDGVLLALDANTGANRGRVEGLGSVSAGVGSDDRHVAVVNAAGELVVVAEGKVQWRKTLTQQVVTPPLVAGGRVFLLATDRSVHAYDLSDGLRLWSTPRSGDALTLKQSGVLLAVGDTLLAGQGARLTAIAPLTGTVLGDVPIGTARGTNEVERLAELVGPAARDGQIVCARAFQFSVGCVHGSEGRTLWSKVFPGFQGVAISGDVLASGDESDRVQAWRVNTGESLWSTEQLKHRGLSRPVSAGTYFVMGDGQGYVHWIDKSTGQLKARASTDGSAVSALAFESGVLLAVTRQGGVFAFQLP